MELGNKKYFIKLPKGEEQTMSLVEPNKFSLSNIIGIIAFIGTVISGLVTLFQSFGPDYVQVTAILMFISGLISAVTGRITGSPGK